MHDPAPRRFLSVLSSFRRAARTLTARAVRVFRLFLCRVADRGPEVKPARCPRRAEGTDRAFLSTSPLSRSIRRAPHAAPCRVLIEGVRRAVRAFFSRKAASPPPGPDCRPALVGPVRPRSGKEAGSCAASGLFRALVRRVPIFSRGLAGEMAGRLRRRSLKRRLMEAFFLLALTSGAVFSLSAYLTYDAIVTHVVRWHMEPILRLLVTAEAGGKDAAQKGLPASEVLAESLRVKWRTGDAIPEDLRPGRSSGRELVRIERDRYALTYRDDKGNDYAVIDKIKDLDDLEEVMLDVLLACVSGSLLAAGLLAWWLGRRLITPLLELARRVKAGEALDGTPLCAREDEVGALARAFAGRERTLRDFLNREQLFTGDVSHELRTPLTVLQGGAEILESRLSGTPQGTDLLPVVERMQRTIASMTATVGTMLLLARKPEQLERRDFDFSALARQETENARRLLAGRDVSLRCCVPETLPLRGNPELAALVLHNLLDNACRYTARGAISLEADAAGFTLTDTAPPIDPGVRARMFERGVRGTARTPGSGLGLSLVQRGCERLGWSVGHEAWEGGNRFHVRFGPWDAPPSGLRPDTQSP